MGLMQHNAVIATTWDHESLCRVWKWIESLPVRDRSLFCLASGGFSDYESIAMVPGRSKEEGAEVEDDERDRLREAFIQQLKRDVYDGDRSCWDWIEVGFGEVGPSIKSAYPEGSGPENKVAELAGRIGEMRTELDEKTLGLAKASGEIQRLNGVLEAAKNLLSAVAAAEQAGQPMPAGSVYFTSLQVAVMAAESTK